MRELLGNVFTERKSRIGKHGIVSYGKSFRLYVNVEKGACDSLEQASYRKDLMATSIPR